LLLNAKLSFFGLFSFFFKSNMWEEKANQKANALHSLGENAEGEGKY